MLKTIVIIALCLFFGARFISIIADMQYGMLFLAGAFIVIVGIIKGVWIGATIARLERAWKE